MVYYPETLSSVHTDYLARLCTADAAIGEAQRLARAFLSMVRERTGERLEGWIAAVQASSVLELRRYASGLQADRAAIEAGLTLEWSNGQTEGQVHRLKLLKR